jgi:hypothetical protein
MSEGDITSDALEQAKRSFEAADSGNYDWMISFYGPGSVFDMSPWGLGTYAGLASIRAFFEDWIGSFEDFEMILEEIEDLGNGVVLAIACQDGLPAGSQHRLHLRHAALSIWEGGIIQRVTNYSNIEEAREIAREVAEEMAKARR